MTDDGFYREALEQLSDGVYFVDRDRRITYWNAAAERLTGFRRDEVVGKRCADGLLRHCDLDGTELCGEACPLRDTMEDGRRRDAHVFLHHRDGHRRPVWVRASPLVDDDGEIVGAIEVFNDATEFFSVRERLDQARQRAETDPLTGLGNRAYLERALERALADWRQHGDAFGVLLIDIDRFKQVNDEHGHAVGDEVLCAVASTMRGSARAGDALGRWGGEEFVIVAREETTSGLRRYAERLRSLVAAAGVRDGRRRVRVTISVGATMATPVDDADSLVTRADDLMYRAKQAGRDCVFDDRDVLGAAPPSASGAG